MDSLHPFSTKMMPLLSNNPTGLPGSGIFPGSWRIPEATTGREAPEGRGVPSRSTRELSVVCSFPNALEGVFPPLPACRDALGMLTCRELCFQPLPFPLELVQGLFQPRGAGQALVRSRQGALQGFRIQRRLCQSLSGNTGAERHRDVPWSARG